MKDNNIVGSSKKERKGIEMIDNKTPISGEVAIKTVVTNTAITASIMAGWMKNVKRPEMRPKRSIKFPRLFVVIFLLSKISSEKPKESLNNALPNILFLTEFAKLILENNIGIEIIAIMIPITKCEEPAGWKYGINFFMKYTTTVYIPKNNPKFP